MGFRLVILEGKGAGKEFYFAQPNVKIGRAPDNDLVLYDMGVSRYHIEILQDGKGFTMRDTGSANGTNLNGMTATEAHIAVGDRIQIGPVVFHFEPAKSPNEPSGIRAMQHGEVFRPTDDGERRALEEGKTAAYRPSLGPQPLARAEPSMSKAREEGRTTTGSFAAYSRRRWAGFMKMPRSTRVAVLVGAGVLAVGVALSVYLVLHPPRTDRSAEIFAADSANAAMSFGCGKVDIFTPDRVNFAFDYQGGRATVLYAAGGVEHETEVEILVNSKHAAYVEPSPGRWTTGIKINLPRPLLRPGINILAFDNTLTPAHPERWGIAQVRIKQSPLPPPNQEKAGELYNLGKAAFDARSVLPSNLYRSIEYFEEAQGHLEAIEPAPDLLKMIRADEARSREDLQKVFDTYLFASEKALRFGDRAVAIETLRDLLRYLPDPEDPRHKQAKSRLANLVGRGAH
ncbi:FHA domain-containing protein [Myxococcota bacterium]